MQTNQRHPIHRRRIQAGSAALLVCLVSALVFAGAAPTPPARAADGDGSIAFLPLIVGPVSALWSGEYYANAGLLGQPTFVTEQEPRIDYDWGNASPDPRLPANQFSVRWTGTWNFEAGEYTFFIYCDDGVRLYLDGQLLIDHWKAGIWYLTKTVTLPAAGSHQVKLEYYEDGGGAAVRLNWRRTDLFPQWTGDFFANLWLLPPVHHIETNSTIEFSWGSGCPIGMVCDNFSVAWDAAPVLPVGTYRAHINADDGFQFYLDGTKIKDGGWDTVRGAFEDTVDFAITQAGTHLLAYNYHERTGQAETRVWIENLSYPLWTAQYYSNPTLSGTPVATLPDTAPFYDWGAGAPAPLGTQKDNYSIRWSGERYFHAGFYRFGFYADDGFRLYVDGELLLNKWTPGLGTHYAPITFLDTGYHDVVIEYFEQTGMAEFRFWWE